jgi:von Willebrand factor type A domain-containing protein
MVGGDILEQPDVSPATVVIFDTSGSMKHDFQGGNSKLQFARSVLDRQLPILVREKRPFGLKQFNGRGKVETVLPIGRHTEDDLSIAFSRLLTTAHGSSPLGQAMIEATRELAETPVTGRSIVALSDGEDSPEKGTPLMPEAFAAIRRVTGSPGARIKPFLIGVGELNEREFASFNLEATELGGGLFPLENAGDEEVARKQALRVFDYAQITRPDVQLRQLLTMNEQLNAQKLATRRMLEQFESRRTASIERISGNVAEFQRSWSGKSSQQEQNIERLLIEIAHLRDTTAKADGDLQTQGASIDRLIKEIEALSNKTSAHRPFSTIFEWSVVAGLGGLLILFVVTGIGLRNADNRIVQQLSGEIEKITTTVDKLWDIWGR